MKPACSFDFSLAKLNHLGLGEEARGKQGKKARKGDSPDSKLGKKGMRTGGGSWLKGKNGEVT